MASGNKVFTATIGRRNDSGFQIDERPGIWLNLSKFVDPQPTIPPLGTICTITVDSQNFVRAIEPVDEPQLPLSGATKPAAPVTDRERTITRLALVKAAARFLADKPDATSTDVELVATKWERWVTRADGES